MSETRPTGEQLRFVSSATGEHILDEYMEAAERGGRTLADLLDDLFDTSGDFRADNFQFRINEATSRLQVRVGQFALPDTGWQDVPSGYIFRQRGAHANATAYERLDVVSYNNGVYICVAAHTSNSGAPGANFQMVINGAALNQAVADAQLAETNAETAEASAISAKNAAEAAAAQVAGYGIPAPTPALNYLRVNSGATAYEVRTPAQVLSDIGAAASSHNHSTANITTGVMNVPRGGTGTGTYTAGYIKSPGGTNAFTSVAAIPQADVTNLVSDLSTINTTLSGKAATVHTHAGADITSGTVGPAYLGTGVRDGTKFLRDDGTWQVVPGAPASYVQSVNGATGIVTVTPANIGAAASVHGHAISDVSNLQTTLDGKQPLDATLTALAGATTGANILAYFSAVDTVATTTLSAAGRALIDDADAAAQRTTLGLGTAAVQNVNYFALASHSHVVADITGLQADLDAKAQLSGATFTGDVSISKATPLFQVTATSGNAGIEIGAPGTSYLDLKNPVSDDFDIRISTNGTGGAIQSTAGLTITSAGANSIVYRSGDSWHDFATQGLLANQYLFAESGNDTGFYWGGDGVIAWKNNGVYRGQINSGGGYETAAMPVNTWAFSTTQNNTDGGGNYVAYGLQMNAGGQVGSVQMVHVPSAWSGVRIANNSSGHTWDFRNNGYLHLPGGASWIQPDGNIYMTWAGDYLSNAVYWSSDASHKRDITPSRKTASTILKRANFVSFEWSTTDQTKPKGYVDVGLVAQELQEVDPTLVKADAKGDLHIIPERFTMHLAKALQEALGEIETLKHRITALEAR